MSDPVAATSDAVAPAVDNTIVYRLESLDGVVFEITEEAVQKSATLTRLVDSLSSEDLLTPVLLNKIDAETLKLVVEWCEQHKGASAQEEAESRSLDEFVIPEWDEAFFSSLNNEMLFKLIVASNFLDVNQLMNYGCKIVANMAKGKSPDELRVIYGIPTDEEDEAAEKAAAEQAAKNDK